MIIITVLVIGISVLGRDIRKLNQADQLKVFGMAINEKKLWILLDGKTQRNVAHVSIKATAHIVREFLKLKQGIVSLVIPVIEPLLNVCPKCSYQKTC